MTPPYFRFLPYSVHASCTPFSEKPPSGACSLILMNVLTSGTTLRSLFSFSRTVILPGIALVVWVIRLWIMQFRYLTRSNISDFFWIRVPTTSKSFPIGPPKLCLHPSSFVFCWGTMHVLFHGISGPQTDHVVPCTFHAIESAQLPFANY